MMEKKKKCCMIDHKKIDAISFCQECKIYMCNKCEKLHSELFKNFHQNINIKDKNIEDIFSGTCTEESHSAELLFFCKNHNKLCCAQCIAKIKYKQNGQHKDCDICTIEDIESEKKNKLKENIKCLEELSHTLEKSINEIKNMLETINKNKEKLKMKIQKIFTTLRNEINNREDKLLLDVDKKYEELFFNEDIIKESEKLPNKIKFSLEKGKLIDAQWKDKKLSSLINDCLNIENNIIKINKINENVKKCNIFNTSINFFPEENGINEMIEAIKLFGIVGRIFDSKIEFDEKLVVSWLNNRYFKSELLFRKTRDGSTRKDFHDKCDNKGITIIFIETTKGYKFGGYTELQWDTNSGDKKDNSTFLFSFNKKQKYIARNGNSSIYCGSGYGPYFGRAEIDFDNETELYRGISYDNSDNTFVLGRQLTNGEQNWDVKELEVYKITYINN